MKTIPLTQGKFAIVDDEDYERLSQHKWCFRGAYAVRGIYSPIDQKTRLVTMHGTIFPVPKGKEIDHINRNKLDNRKANLRAATRTQNIINVSRANRHNQVGLRGVQMTPRGRYYSGIKVNGKRKHLGMFSTAEDAHAAYVEAKRKFYGEFAPV